MANIQDSEDGNAVLRTSAAASSRVPGINENHCAKAVPSAIKRGGGAAEWTEGQTKLLLEYYYQYFPQIGPFKKFKNRKQAFRQISKDIEEVLGIRKTAEQCENKYKAIIRRRKSAADSNNKSGASPYPVPFDDEIRKIQSTDDSIEPEVQRDALGASYRELSATPVVSASIREPSGTPGTFATSNMDPSATPGMSTTSNAESTDGSETDYLHPAKIGACHTNSTRFRHMHMFFAEMRTIQEERAARNAAKEVKKEEQRAARRAERQCALEERRSMHKGKMNILREVLQLRKYSFRSALTTRFLVSFKCLTEATSAFINVYYLKMNSFKICINKMWQQLPSALKRPVVCLVFAEDMCKPMSSKGLPTFYL